jgi:hypothetical protein
LIHWTKRQRTMNAEADDAILQRFWNPNKRIYWESPLGLWVPWRPRARPWARLGPPGTSPVAGGGAYTSFFCVCVFSSTVAARGGQTGADHFSSKPRLVLPTVPQIGRGSRRNAFKLQQWAIGGQLTRYRQTLAPNRQKFAGSGLTEPRLPIVVV